MWRIFSWLKNAKQKPEIEIHVCTGGRTCPKRGSPQLVHDLKAALQAENLSDKVVVIEENCLSLCSTAPNVILMPFGHKCCRATVDSVLAAVKEKLKK